MPEQNTRIVVTGAPRADKEFDVVSNDGKEAQRLAKLLATDAEAAERELRRLLRESRRPFDRGQRS